MRTLALPVADVTRVEGVPVMTPMRTLADLVEQWVDLSLVADALRDADARGVADLRELAQHLAPLSTRDGLPSGEAFAEQLALDAGLGVPA